MFIEKKYWVLLVLLISTYTHLHTTYAQPPCVSIGVAAPDGYRTFATRTKTFHLDHALVYYDIRTDGYDSVRTYLNQGVGIILALKFSHTESSKKGVLAQILAGTYDAKLTALARNIRTDGRPISIRPLYEANGDWYPWQAYYVGNHPRDVVPAWKHIVSLFRNKQAPVRFDFNANRKSAGTRGLSDLVDLYPGDAFVDSVSVSTYNRCGTSKAHTTWHSFSDEFKPAYDALVKMTARPIGVAETSSTALCGGDKPGWFTQLFHDIATGYPRVENITFYLDQRDSGVASNDVPLHWQLETDAEKNAFRAGITELRATRGTCTSTIAPTALSTATQATWHESLRFPWSVSLEGTGYVHERPITALNTVTGEDFGKAEGVFRWKLKQSALWDVWGGTFGPWISYGGAESANKNRWWDNVQTVAGGLEYCSKKLSFVDWGNLCGVFGAEGNWYTAPIPDRLEGGDEKIFFRLRLNAGGEW
jgi:Glycosyl hydrolase family 26